MKTPSRIQAQPRAKTKGKRCSELPERARDVNRVYLFSFQLQLNCLNRKKNSKMERKRKVKV